MAKDSVLRGLESVKILGICHQGVSCFGAQKYGEREAQLALTPRSCPVCTDITCQVRLHQCLQRSEDKMKSNVSRNKYQQHRMQPVTATSTVASNACHIHTHHKLVFMNDAATGKPNLNRLYNDNIFHDYHLGI